jgi:hypothetical protein
MSLRIGTHAERLLYRVAGLPVALAALWSGFNGDAADPLQSAFAWSYWHPDGAGEWSELIGGLIAWPLAVLAGSLWYTWRNGAVIRQRHGRSFAGQFSEQIRLYFSSGLLAPWYYIFSVYEGGGTSRANGYLHRFQTKPSIFMLLKRKKGSPLTDKVKFGEYCTARGLACVPTLLELDGVKPATNLPDHDLFVKLSKGRGGQGAERWDRVTTSTFEGPDGEVLDSRALLDRLVIRSRRDRLIVQPRLRTHWELSDLTAGALPTVRVVTCLNEAGEPELIGAVFRMSIGTNRTVDNLHAGGIAAAVDLESGRLSRATNLGADARLGWLSAHPDTKAQIEGRTLPFWDQVKQLALSAHRAFADRVVIGWDIAIRDGGPIIVEGNGNPDMDILQRFMREGLRQHRFAQLLGYHLRERTLAMEQRLCASSDPALHAAHEASRFHSHQRQADAGRAGVGAQLSQE